MVILVKILSVEKMRLHASVDCIIQFQLIPSCPDIFSVEIRIYVSGN